MAAAVCYKDYSPHGRQETGMRQRAGRHNPSNAAASELLTHSRHIIKLLEHRQSALLERKLNLQLVSL